MDFGTGRSNGMSILQYFARKGGLPDPQGELSSTLPPSAIAMANSEIEKSNSCQSRKRGPYVQYSAKERAEIGKYACTNGIAATSRVFSRKLGHQVSKTTIVSIKKAYLEQKQLQEQEVGCGSVRGEVKLLPCKQRGRPLLLGALDRKVQLLLEKIRSSGGVVNTRIALAAAKGIVMYYSPSFLVENGGHTELIRNWAMSILQRMNFVKTKLPLQRAKKIMRIFRKEKQNF